MTDSDQPSDQVPTSLTNLTEASPSSQTAVINAVTSSTALPSNLPTNPLTDLDNTEYVPENPFLPRWPAQGPVFLDTNACICALQKAPDGNTSSQVWECQGNSTSDPYTSTSGKWFNTANAVGNVSTALNDASNPPVTDYPFVVSGNSTLVPLASVDPNPLSVFDQACTGINRTNFTTSYYRAKDELDNKQTPIDAAPCWRPGAIPIPLTKASSWQNETGFFGCRQGFFCP